MRVEVNRGQLLKKFKRVEEFIDESKQEVLRGAADFLVEESPVDTGTYIDNHNIGEGNSVPVSSVTSSEGRRGYFDLEGPSYDPFSNRVERDEARQRLYTQILQLPDNWKRASLSNSAAHFYDVEYGGTNWTGKYGPRSGYLVYTQLRANWPRIKQEAIARVEAKYSK